MKRIENIADFLNWSHEANLCLDSHMKCDLQDTFARSDIKILKRLFIDNITEKRILLFGIYKTMSDETFFDFVNAYARHEANRVIEEQQEDLEKQSQANWTKKQELIGIAHDLNSGLCDIAIKISGLIEKTSTEGMTE
jgi:hypothetical protein